MKRKKDVKSREEEQEEEASAIISIQRAFRGFLARGHRINLLRVRLLHQLQFLFPTLSSSCGFPQRLLVNPELQGPETQQFLEVAIMLAFTSSKPLRMLPSLQRLQQCLHQLLDIKKMLSNKALATQREHSLLLNERKYMTTEDRISQQIEKMSIEILHRVQTAAGWEQGKAVEKERAARLKRQREEQVEQQLREEEQRRLERLRREEMLREERRSRAIYDKEATASRRSMETELELMRVEDALTRIRDDDTKRAMELNQQFFSLQRLRTQGHTANHHNHKKGDHKQQHALELVQPAIRFSCSVALLKEDDDDMADNGSKTTTPRLTLVKAGYVSAAEKSNQEALLRTLRSLRHQRTVWMRQLQSAVAEFSRTHALLAQTRDLITHMSYPTRRERKERVKENERLEEELFSLRSSLIFRCRLVVELARREVVLVGDLFDSAKEIGQTSSSGHVKRDNEEQSTRNRERTAEGDNEGQPQFARNNALSLSTVAETSSDGLKEKESAAAAAADSRGGMQPLQALTIAEEGANEDETALEVEPAAENNAVPQTSDADDEGCPTDDRHSLPPFLSASPAKARTTSLFSIANARSSTARFLKRSASFAPGKRAVNNGASRLHDWSKQDAYYVASLKDFFVSSIIPPVPAVEELASLKPPSVVVLVGGMGVGAGLSSKTVRQRVLDESEIASKGITCSVTSSYFPSLPPEESFAHTGRKGGGAKGEATIAPPADVTADEKGVVVGVVVTSDVNTPGKGGGDAARSGSRPAAGYRIAGQTSFVETDVSSYDFFRWAKAVVRWVAKVVLPWVREKECAWRARHRVQCIGTLQKLESFSALAAMEMRDNDRQHNDSKRSQTFDAALTAGPVIASAETDVNASDPFTTLVSDKDTRLPRFVDTADPIDLLALLLGCWAGVEVTVFDPLRSRGYKAILSAGQCDDLLARHPASIALLASSTCWRSFLPHSFPEHQGQSQEGEEERVVRISFGISSLVTEDFKRLREEEKEVLSALQSSATMPMPSGSSPEERGGVSPSFVSGSVRIGKQTKQGVDRETGSSSGAGSVPKHKLPGPSTVAASASRTGKRLLNAAPCVVTLSTPISLLPTLFNNARGASITNITTSTPSLPFSRPLDPPVLQFCLDAQALKAAVAEDLQQLRDLTGLLLRAGALRPRPTPSRQQHWGRPPPFQLLEVSAEGLDLTALIRSAGGVPRWMQPVYSFHFSRQGGANGGDAFCVENGGPNDAGDADNYQDDGSVWSDRESVRSAILSRRPTPVSSRRPSLSRSPKPVRPSRFSSAATAALTNERADRAVGALLKLLHSAQGAKDQRRLETERRVDFLAKEFVVRLRLGVECRRARLSSLTKTYTVAVDQEVRAAEEKRRRVQNRGRPPSRQRAARSQHAPPTGGCCPGIFPCFKNSTKSVGRVAVSPMAEDDGDEPVLTVDTKVPHALLWRAAGLEEEALSALLATKRITLEEVESVRSRDIVATVKQPLSHVDVVRFSVASPEDRSGPHSAAVEHIQLRLRQLPLFLRRQIMPRLAATTWLPTNSPNASFIDAQEVAAAAAGVAEAAKRLGGASHQSPHRRWPHHQDLHGTARGKLPSLSPSGNAYPSQPPSRRLVDHHHTVLDADKIEVAKGGAQGEGTTVRAHHPSPAQSTPPPPRGDGTEVSLFGGTADGGTVFLFMDGSREKDVVVGNVPQPMRLLRFRQGVRDQSKGISAVSNVYGSIRRYNEHDSGSSSSGSSSSSSSSSGLLLLALADQNDALLSFPSAALPDSLSTSTTAPIASSSRRSPPDDAFFPLVGAARLGFVEHRQLCRTLPHQFADALVPTPSLLPLSSQAVELLPGKKMKKLKIIAGAEGHGEEGEAGDEQGSKSHIQPVAVFETLWQLQRQIVDFTN